MSALAYTIHFHDIVGDLPQQRHVCHRSMPRRIGYAMRHAMSARPVTTSAACTLRPGVHSNHVAHHDVLSYATHGGSAQGKEIIPGQVTGT
jgi:hypothetical protein